MRINRSTDCDKPLRRIFASSKGKIGLIAKEGWIFVKKIILNGEMLFIPESASAK